MARKKKSEMTIHERVDSALKGETWDYAEEFGIEVLARCVALHVYSRKDGEEYLSKIMTSICKRGDEWAHEGNHPFVLAMAAVGQRVKDAGGLEEYIAQSRKERYGEGN